MLRLRAVAPDSLVSLIPNDPLGRTELDVFRIGGEYTPGWLEVQKAGQTFTWDKRKGYGWAGATLVFTGNDLNEFETVHWVNTGDQVIEWAAFQKKYLDRPPAQPQQNGAFLPLQPKPKALGVYHPILSEVGIDAIVPKTIGQWTPQKGRGRGVWKKTIQWIQYRAPVLSLGRPNGAIPDTKKGAPSASDAMELQQRAVQQQIDAAHKDLARRHR